MERKKYILKLSAVFIVIVMTAVSGLFGCKKEQPPASAKTPAAQTGKVGTGRATLQKTESVEEKPGQEGYVYRRRDRRDPFKPLIETTKTAKKKGGVKIGTLESYDISEFSLSAIAKKGDEYFALIIAPDNRSFTVNRGSLIGLNKGRVDEITGDRVVMLEFTKDFRGELRPRQIILEFHKGEGE